MPTPNPSGIGAAASGADTQLGPQIELTLRGLRGSFASGSTRERGWRQRQLTGILKFLRGERAGIQAALREDLGKSRGDADAEALTVALETLHAKRHLRSWMRDARVSSPLLLAPSRSFIRHEPLGVVLIFGAWNYPLHLTLMPLVGALAAGNAVLIKPSELAPATSKLLAETLGQYVDPAAVRVVEGGADVAEHLLEQRFDHIFYTGSGEIGSRVMQAAARHLTPVTLELGGKSPVIVERSADIETTARRLAFAKWTNAGQTCVAPDYVLVEDAVADEFIAAMSRMISEFYGPEPKESRAYSRIVNERHLERVRELLASGRVFAGGEVDADERYIAPTLLVDVSPDDPVMQEEVFGPILPVLRVDSVRDAISFIESRPAPLALYLFSKSRAMQRAVLDGTRSGSVCLNHAGVQLLNPELPFGGVGESGMGAYHGKASFDTFSHRRSVLKKPFFFDPRALYPQHRGSRKKV